jgi:hypothetical protein
MGTGKGADMMANVTADSMDSHIIWILSMKTRPYIKRAVVLQASPQKRGKLQPTPQRRHAH